MHVQRVILITPAVMGFLATGLAVLGVLPWVTPSFELPQELIEKNFDGRLFEWKIRADLIALACFPMAAAMCMFGGLSKPMSWLGRIVIFVLSLPPLAAGVIILLNFSTTVKELMDDFIDNQAELLWPGLGAWLVLGSAVVLLISTLVVGRFGRERPHKDRSPAKTASEGEQA